MLVSFERKKRGEDAAVEQRATDTETLDDEDGNENDVGLGRAVGDEVYRLSSDSETVDWENAS